jgi:hypothetical protein
MARGFFCRGLHEPEYCGINSTYWVTSLYVATLTSELSNAPRAIRAGLRHAMAQALVEATLHFEPQEVC